MTATVKRYGLYLLRWQLSTPILAGVLVLLSQTDKMIATVIANFIGGLIFFWVDRFIFRSPKPAAEMEAKDATSVQISARGSRGYRIPEGKGYDRTKIHQKEENRYV
jgi:hypothetical protein